jgi:hypothetical protein
MNMEAVPNSTDETQYLDLSEKEYNRMISQQMMYHKVMMEDLMKLSTETEAGNSSSQTQTQTQDQLMRQMSLVAGLGNTIETMDASRTQLLDLANKKSNQGSANAQTASMLSANMNEINTNLRNVVTAYDALQQEGFSNSHDDNHSMKAALDNSAVVLESQKYALVLFGAFSIYLLYKTVKYL